MGSRSPGVGEPRPPGRGHGRIDPIAIGSGEVDQVPIRQFSSRCSPCCPGNVLTTMSNGVVPSISVLTAALARSSPASRVCRVVTSQADSHTATRAPGPILLRLGLSFVSADTILSYETPRRTPPDACIPKRKTVATGPYAEGVTQQSPGSPKAHPGTERTPHLREPQRGSQRPRGVPRDPGLRCATPSA
jgi:hypothetical protein